MMCACWPNMLQTCPIFIPQNIGVKVGRSEGVPEIAETGRKMHYRDPGVLSL